MVLTNLEFWAADGSSSSLPASASSLEFETSAHHHHARQLNPFDPRVIPHVPNIMTHHLSSNGYYGFSYVNAAHEMELNNNNIDLNHNNNNIDDITSITTTHNHNFMANDVNGTPAVAAELQRRTTPAGGNVGIVSRCKKRFFVNDDSNSEDNVAAAAAYQTNASAKRCRFDDDFAAQYCNDFFSLPSTQIATQSCLMDTEEGVHQQQQYLQHQQHDHQQQLHQLQVDEAMLENNNNNNNNINNNNNYLEKYKESVLHLQTQTQQQPPTIQVQQQQQQQQQHPYHQQQHYQDLTDIATPLPSSSSSSSFTKIYDNHLSNTKELRYLPNITDDCDDATLFAQIHGGCYYHYCFNRTATSKRDCRLPSLSQTASDEKCQEVEEI